MVNNMNIEDYKKLRTGNSNKSRLKVFIMKLLILLIIFLLTIIGMNKNQDLHNLISKKLLSENFSFYYIQNIYTKYFGEVFPFYNLLGVEPVFSEKLEYSEVSKYNDGIVLSVSSNYLVPVQYSGIVIFIGEKENYGNTVIIQGDDVTIWYSNILSDAKLYDEVKKGEYLGETIGNKLYLVFQKDGEIVNYKDYI